MKNTNQTAGKTATDGVGLTETQKLKNGLTAYENLLVCIDEGTAIATTFEVAIAEEGLTMEMIRLIKTYYTDSDYPETVSEDN